MSEAKRNSLQAHKVQGRTRKAAADTTRKMESLVGGMKRSRAEEDAYNKASGMAKGGAVKRGYGKARC